MADILYPTRECSSLSLMELYTHYDAIVKLGKKLTNELDLDQSVDTLGRWMAYYIAELIQDAETACPEEQPTKKKAVYDAILKLWEHRYVFNHGKRPFEELEPLLRTLKSLDPEDDTPKYFRLIRELVDDSNENDNVKTWFKFINDLDHAAKILIRYGLAQAAQGALDKSREWVILASAAGIDEEPEIPVVRIIEQESQLLEENDPDSEEIKCKKERAAKLEKFAQQALKIAAELRNQ